MDARVTPRGANLLSGATFGKNKRFDYFSPSLTPIFVDVGTKNRANAIQPVRWFGAEGKVHRIVDSAPRFIGDEGADYEVHLRTGRV